MTSNLVITQEVPPLPKRRDDAHKGDVGRIVIIGGCDNGVTMVGAVALAANAAYRSGAGLVQVFVPHALRTAVAILAPCATVRSLPRGALAIIEALRAYRADVVAVGPGLGASLSASDLLEILTAFEGAVVVDADGLNLLASAIGQQSTKAAVPFPTGSRIVLTPHVGEARRLLAAAGRDDLDLTSGGADARRAAAIALAEGFNCTIVLKGQRTVVTNGRRLYVNETGNAGMATGGTGDVLTGVLAALIGQKMEPLEASILASYLHGLAGDFAAEELGRWALTATDLVEYLPEAFCDFDLADV